jgi:hypothetical protein
LAIRAGKLECKNPLGAGGFCRGADFLALVLGNGQLEQAPEGIAESLGILYWMATFLSQLHKMPDFCCHLQLLGIGIPVQLNRFYQAGAVLSAIQFATFEGEQSSHQEFGIELAGVEVQLAPFLFLPILLRHR